MKNNPWESLNNNRPFVLASDIQIIEDHNNNPKTNENHKIHTELYPEPFLGNPDADVVLLNLNPGFSPDDSNFHQSNEYFIQQARKNLLHKSDHGFYLLDEKIKEAPGYTWWNNKLKALIEKCGREQVAQNLLCVELFPYHSKKFKKIAPLKSQKYAFNLLKKAIKRNAIIIIMRSEELWIESVPEIKIAIERKQCSSLKNPQSVYLTKGNLPEGVFDQLIKKIKG